MTPILSYCSQLAAQLYCRKLQPVYMLLKRQNLANLSLPDVTPLACAFSLWYNYVRREHADY